MPRPPRQTEPGVVYHVLNRRVMRLPMFEKPEDYAAFERVLADALERPDAAELLAYCLMPNHWHLVVQAGRRTNLSTWMQWLTVTHTHRWHAHRQAVGEGPLYQGRFKSFPVEADEHFLRLCCYVEANPVRARLTRQAESWQWCSFAARRNRGVLFAKLAAWPVERPRNWGAEVSFAMDDDSLKVVRQSIARGVPYGTPDWQQRIAARLGLEITLRPRGRPRKAAQKSS
jgi:putative transposase